jgi:hypothetical protein
MKLVVVVVTALALQGAAFKATFVGGGHAPPINTRWAYSVKVTDAKGKALAARISAVVVDPIGAVHPVEFFSSATKHVTNFPIKGTFKDAIIWPPESGGYELTFRVTVKVGTTKRVLTYRLTPKLPAPQ